MLIREKEKLENILIQMANFRADDNKKITDGFMARKYLQCAYDLFGSWRSKIGYILEGSYDENNFWSFFEKFCKESENGSWSLMCMNNSKVEKEKLKFFSTVRDILLSRGDIQKIILLLNNVTDNSSQNRIIGLSPFPLTAILFASDEENYMVLDKPVLNYFGFSNYGEALPEYREIINKSRDYSKKFNLPMWYINKAYGILSNGCYLEVKKLKGQCLSLKDKNFPYRFKC